MDQTAAPLDGVRVLDIATFVAAPFAAACFAEFGADVIKIEKPGIGDSLRQLGTESDAGSGRRDASRLLASASLMVQQIARVDAEPVLAKPGEQAVIDALKPDFLVNPRVSVDVLNYRPFYIIGEVKRPGSYPYVNGMTIVNAIALAGGYTYRAQEKEVLIMRARDAERKQQPADHETVVLPGDVIEVPERFW